MVPWLGLDPMWVITSCIHEPSKFDYRPTSLDTFLGRFMFTLIFTLWVCFLIQVITCIDYIWLTLLLSLVTWCFIWLSSDDEKNYPLGYIIVSSSTSSRFPSGLHWYSCYSLGLKEFDWLTFGHYQSSLGLSASSGNYLILLLLMPLQVCQLEPMLLLPFPGEAGSSSLPIFFGFYSGGCSSITSSPRGQLRFGSSKATSDTKRLNKGLSEPQRIWY